MQTDLYKTQYVIIYCEYSNRVRTYITIKMAFFFCRRPGLPGVPIDSPLTVTINYLTDLERFFISISFQSSYKNNVSSNYTNYFEHKLNSI